MRVVAEAGAGDAASTLVHIFQFWTNESVLFSKVNYGMIRYYSRMERKTNTRRHGVELCELNHYLGINTKIMSWIISHPPATEWQTQRGVGSRRNAFGTLNHSSKLPMPCRHLILNTFFGFDANYYFYLSNKFSVWFHVLSYDICRMQDVQNSVGQQMSRHHPDRQLVRQMASKGAPASFRSSTLNEKRSSKSNSEKKCHRLDTRQTSCTVMDSIIAVESPFTALFTFVVAHINGPLSRHFI